MDQIEGNTGSPQSVLAYYFSNVQGGYGTTATIFYILAHITLVMLAVSPVPTLMRICKNKSTEKFQPYPYAGGVMYFGIWIIYTCEIHPPSYAFHFLCLPISVFVGFFLFKQYCMVFAMFSSDPYKVVVLLPMVVGTAWFTTFLFFLHSWTKAIRDDYVVYSMMQTYLMGPLVVLLGAFMYGSPLFVVKRVFMTRSIEYMPFWFSLSCFLNGLLWFIYACLPQTFDLYIAIANGIGALLGFLQLIVFFMFYDGPKDIDRLIPYEGKAQSHYKVVPIMEG